MFAWFFRFLNVFFFKFPSKLFDFLTATISVSVDFRTLRENFKIDVAAVDWAAARPILGWACFLPAHQGPEARFGPNLALKIGPARPGPKI